MTTKPAPQIVKYTFYKVDPAWRRLASETRAQDKRELAGVLESASQKLMIRAYSTMGMRGDADMLVCGAGVRPNIDFLNGSGLDTGLGLLVDRQCEVRAPQNGIVIAIGRGGTVVGRQSQVHPADADG